AQNALSPAPVTTTHRHRCSARKRSKSSHSSSAVRVSKALATSGRSSVTSRTSWRWSSARTAASLAMWASPCAGALRALLRRLCAVLADRNAAGADLAVRSHACTDEYRCSRDQKRLVAGNEVDDRRAVRHEDLLR